MKLFVALLFLSIACFATYAQDNSSSGSNWPLPDDLPFRKKHPGDRYLRKLQTLSGRVTVMSVGSNTKVSSLGKRLVFQNIRCYRCVYVAVVRDDETYAVTLLPGTYRIVVDSGDTKRPYDALAPEQPRTVEVKDVLERRTEFDVALRIYLIDVNLRKRGGEGQALRFQLNVDN